MYYSRQFWREAALENSSPDVETTVSDKYIISYNKNTKKYISLNYLNFKEFNDFKEKLNEVENLAKDLDISRVSVSLRQSDPVHYDETLMGSLNLKKVVELSKCGIEITKSLIEDLTKKALPKEYTSKTVDFDDVISNPLIHELICNNFADGFAASPEEARQILENYHKNSTHKNSIDLYYIIEKDDKPVGFSSGTISTQGMLKDLLHLRVGVVDEQHRKKGLYKELLKLRIKGGFDRGVKFAYTEADVTTSRPILERLGLQEFDRVKIFHKDL